MMSFVMKTALGVAASIWLLGCSGGERAGSSDLPPDLNGGYRKVSSQPLPSGNVPELIRSMGLRAARTAQYEGPERFQVTVFEMNSGSSAFELAQKWKSEPGRIHFHKGSSFLLLESSGADNATLNRLAALVEKQREP